MKRKQKVAIDKFMGMSKRFDADKINTDQAAYMENVDCTNGNDFRKRDGQADYHASYGTGGINGSYYYKGKVIEAWNNKIYSDGTVIYTGVTNAEMTFFIYNGLLYCLNGYEFLVYDGSTVKDIESTAYAPLIFINSTPDGIKKDDNESLNLISGKFRVKFNPDGTSKTFKLPYTNLDSIDTIVGLGAYTTDLSAGTVTFTTAPIAGTSTLEITATKNSLKDSAQIKGCLYAYEYNKKIFLTGNKLKPNWVWIMGVTDNYDGGYWPAKGFEQVGGSEEACTGFAGYYDKLLMLKERSIFLASYVTVGENTFIEILPLNKSIGCDIPGSIQVVNNAPVFANTYRGICTLVSTALENEKNVMTVSDNINPMLLADPKELLKKASSVDYNGRYWLCVDNKVYIWDYKSYGILDDTDKLIWLYYTNINAAKFLTTDRLLYGDRTAGKLVQFIKAKNDFGQPIKAVWRSKQFDFDYPLWYKTVQYMSFVSKPESKSNVYLKYITDDGTEEENESVTFNSFSWLGFRWPTFSWGTNNFAEPIPMKPMSRRIRYWQLEIYNNMVNEDLEVSKIFIEYILEREVR